MEALPERRRGECRRRTAEKSASKERWERCRKDDGENTIGEPPKSLRRKSRWRVSGKNVGKALTMLVTNSSVMLSVRIPEKSVLSAAEKTIRKEL